MSDNFITEARDWVLSIFRIETTTKWLGGEDGVANRQAKELAARTNYLKDLLENLQSHKQDQDPTLVAIAALATAADKFIYFTGEDQAAIGTVTAFARSLLAGADAAAVRALLSAVSQAELNAAIAGLVNSSPATLDTLKELADALGDDPNFSVTMTNALAARVQIADLQKGTYVTATAGGTADAITAAYTPAITTDTAGRIPEVALSFKATAANTTAGATFNAGTGAFGFVKGASTAIVAGDIPGAGAIVQIIGRRGATAADDKWVILNPATGVSSGLSQATADSRYCGIGYMLIQHQVAQNMHGGSAVSGIQTRPLNTVVANTIAGASLSSNQITLPAGTYRVRGSAEAFHVNASKIAIYNVTDAVYVVHGGSVNGEYQLSDLMTSEVSIIGRFSLPSTKVLELRQFCEIAYATSGLGYPSNSMGVEVYASLEFMKES